MLCQYPNLQADAMSASATESIAADGLACVLFNFFF